MNDWNYVSSESNVADKTSRYQTFEQLSLEKPWCNGPTFLSNNDFNDEIENETFSINSVNITKSSVKKFTLNWEYYSSFKKLTRHLAWIIKLLKNWLNWKRGHVHKEDFNYLKFKDIQDSRALLFHLAQHESYMKEIFPLSSKQTVDKNSTILSFTSFLDKNNYLYVGGRLKHANIPTNSKNQIILSKDLCLFRLLIKGIHEQNAHVGREHTLSFLRKHFWTVT